MRHGLEALLNERHPAVFRGRTRPITESLMAFGCEHGDGWFGILDAICEALERFSRPEDQVPEAVQIKEKFGELRFYYDGGDMADYGVTGLAENFSRQICEVTGVPGRLTSSKGYYRTLSAEQAKKAKAELAVKDTDCIGYASDISSDEIATRRLARIRSRLAAAADIKIDIPAGWLELADVLLDYISRSAPLPLIVREIGEREGRLYLDVVKADPDSTDPASTEHNSENSSLAAASAVGAITFAWAMSARLDRETGACIIPAGPEGE